MLIKKSITVFTTNYYPEDSAIGLYTTQLVTYLSNHNHEIKVVTGFPNYPFWKIFPNFQNNPQYYTETINGIEILRYKQYIPNAVTFFGRILMMLSLTYGVLINSFKIKKSDITICIVPYTFLLLPAAIFSWRKSSKLLVHVQDFEFDLAFESGIAKSNLLFKIVRKPVFLFEKFLLKKAHAISTISNNMMDVGYKKTGKKIYYFPNWISESNINSNDFQQHVYIDKSKFSLLYSGNVGEKQDWQTLLAIAKMITPKDNIEIVLVGSGAYIEALKKQIAPFTFIKIFDPVPYSDLNNLLCSANMHFLFQKTEVLDTVMPSKLLGMMASEKPSIVTGNINSEVKTIFDKSNCGIYLGSNDATVIYNEILKLKSNNALQSEMGRSARQYVLQHFSEGKVLSKYYDEVISLI